MLIQIESIAKKYALAYLNLYANELTDEMINNLIRLRKFLNKHKDFYAYLSIPKLPQKTKSDFIDKLGTAFNLTHSKIKLMHVLLDQKRIGLLDATLKKIAAEYHVRKGVVLLKICTSHETDNKQKDLITKFVQKLIKKNVEIDFCINKNLISGIRIKSSTLLWEHSVSKHLKKFKNNLSQQVEL